MPGRVIDITRDPAIDLLPANQLLFLELEKHRFRDDEPQVRPILFFVVVAPIRPSALRPIFDDFGLTKLLSHSRAGLSSMPTIFSRVDLPQPEGPITATNSPRFTSMLMLFRAVVSTLSER